MFGPIFGRQWRVAPRRLRFYMQRVVFVLVLFSVLCTTWALMAGMQPVRDLGDFSRFGVLVFQIVAPMELAILMFFSAVTCASSVAQEKDRRTLVLLLLTRLSNFQVVIGKLAANLLGIGGLILCAMPLMLLIALMGGVSIPQVLMSTAVIGATAMWCGALATLVAFWREKTFQTLAVTFLTIAGVLVIGEVIAAGRLDGISPGWADMISPLRALWVVCQPLAPPPWLGLPGGAPTGYCLFSCLAFAGLSTWAVWKLRDWNPSQQIRPQAPEPDEDYAVQQVSTASETAATWKARSPRPMWNNPVLWREVRTWAYGRKLWVIRLIYSTLFVAAIFALHSSVITGLALEKSRLAEELLPVAAKILAPFVVVSLVLINALAVNSVTNERDALALDLLLATQITPLQFLSGKLIGVFYVTKEMVLGPLLLVGYLWYSNGISTPNLLYVLGALLVVDLFAAMLGIHCGMIYAQSRLAIGTSLGTLFFLFLGIATCMMIMMSFRGSFARQLPPFLAIILGGGTGLFMAMGSRNPSPAIALA
ncbi:MAG TPA: hypothetical protein DCF63_09090, partial [Planctomycetaceae bacterium]|nr:hypothetical protein [Planctomycetaceae bacterium]